MILVVSTRVAEPEVKYPTFPNFRLRLLNIGNEVCLLKSMEIAQQKKRFQQKFQKKLHQFNRNSQLRSVMQK